MALKIGNRVTVLPGVSDRFDRGSLQTMAYAGEPEGTGIPRAHLVGKRGEVVAIDGDKYLVDDQIVDGQPRGACTMREWFVEDELELG